MKWIILLMLALTIGCATAQDRKPSSENSSLPSRDFEGKNADALTNVMRSQNVEDNCQGNFCEIEVQDITCTNKRNSSQANCTWKALLNDTNQIQEQKISLKQAAILYNTLKNLGLEKCDGNICGIKLKTINCSKERFLSNSCAIYE